MLIRQSKNSFIRFYEHGTVGFITNQLNHISRYCYDSGADFLSKISRKPQEIENIISSLALLYDVDKELLRQDFLDFIQELAKDELVVTGATVEQINLNDKDFCYSNIIDTETSNRLDEDVKEQADNKSKDVDSSQKKSNILKSLQLELTSCCNERCIHCYIPNSKKNFGKDMVFSCFKSIIDQFVAMGGIKVTLSGGEALLNKELVRMLRYCREKDLQIILFSNLISLSDEHVKLLKDINVSLVQVSLYSINPDIHDKITSKKGSFERTIKSIEKLYISNIPIQIACPVMKANKDSIGDVIRYAKQKGIRYKTDYIIFAQSDLETKNLANRLSVEETEDVIRKIISADKNYFKQKSNTTLSLEEKANEPFCNAGFSSLNISSKGEVFLCPGWDRFVVGNINNQPLEEIWNTSDKIKMVREIRQKDFPKCLSCEASYYCAMCLMRNFNESLGDMFNINEQLCEIAFMTKRLVEENM